MKSRGKHISLVAVALPILVVLLSCGGGKPTPKPRGYFRIDLLDKAYQAFDTAYPYKFEYPTYGKPELLHSAAEKYWMNLNFPHYNATVYISYKMVGNNLAGLLEDYHKMSYRHSIKADAIAETPFVNYDAKVYGMLTEVAGDAASPIQFYVTDSVHHFLRGALYFYSPPNRDSLNPLIDYLGEDIRHMIESIRWKQ